nr:hypothetical protein [uncultured Pseudogulbenkiania sp.]
MGTCFRKLNKAALTTALAACMAAIGLGTAPPAFAADPSDQSIFELGPGQACDEGGLTNILGDTTSCSSGTPSAGPDWADLFVVNPNGTVSTGNNLYGGVVARFIQDQPGNVADQTTYTSQGSDTNSQHPTEWTWTTASVPSKDDITNAYVYEKIVNGHRMLYVGAEREAPNGDSHIDFEFYQNNVGLDHTPPCPANTICKFTGTNKDGDLLISMDFTTGGSLAGLSIRARHEGVKSKQVDTVLGKVATGDNYDLIGVVPAGCNFDVGGVHTVCAFSNGGTIDGGPWVNVDGQGNEIFSLQKNAFTEWGIDLTALNLTSSCFPSVLVKTRSSQSITAQLKDFALRDFENCSAGVKTEIRDGSENIITGSTSVVGGTVIHDSVVVTGSPTGGSPTGKVIFYRWDNKTCSGTPASTSAEIDLTAGGLDSNGNPTAVANSGTYTTIPGQDISYFASYGGDLNYPAIPLPSPVPSASCEPLGVTTLSSSVFTRIRQDSASGTILNNTAVDISGGTVNTVDVATVTATVGSNVTAVLGDASCSSPTSAVPGSVTFSKYTAADCSGTPVLEYKCVGNTSFSSGIATATAVSSTNALSDSAFLCLRAKYNGNAAYNASDPSDKEPLCAFPFVPFTTTP